MNKKILFYISVGILAASLICLVTGLIIYYVAAGIRLDTAAENYSHLASDRSRRMILGLIIIIIGGVTAAFPLFALFILLIITLIARCRNKQ